VGLHFFNKKRKKKKKKRYKIWLGLWRGRRVVNLASKLERERGERGVEKKDN